MIRSANAHNERNDAQKRLDEANYRVDKERERQQRREEEGKERARMEEENANRRRVEEDRRAALTPEQRTEEDRAAREGIEQLDQWNQMTPEQQGEAIRNFDVDAAAEEADQFLANPVMGQNVPAAQAGVAPPETAGDMLRASEMNRDAMVSFDLTVVALDGALATFNEAARLIATPMDNLSTAMSNPELIGNMGALASALRSIKDGIHLKLATPKLEVIINANNIANKVSGQVQIAILEEINNPEGDFTKKIEALKIEIMGQIGRTAP